jgi:hypothetical protein
MRQTLLVLLLYTRKCFVATTEIDFAVVEGIYNNNCHRAIAPGYIQEMLDTLTQPGYVNGINPANKLLYSIPSKGRKLPLCPPIHKIFLDYMLLFVGIACSFCIPMCMRQAS